MKHILIVISFFSLLSLSNSTEFEITILANEARCFGQFLTQASPFHFKAEAHTGPFDLVLRHKDQTQLIRKSSQTQMTKKIDSFSSVNDIYGFCIQNGDSKQSFVVALYHGIQLSDLAALPKKEDSKLIDDMVEKINQVYQVVKEQESYSKVVNEYNMELQKMVSFKTVGFGFLSITVVLIISFLHYLEIKRVLKNRKVI